MVVARSAQEETEMETLFALSLALKFLRKTFLLLFSLGLELPGKGISLKPRESGDKPVLINKRMCAPSSSRDPAQGSRPPELPRASSFLPHEESALLCPSMPGCLVWCSLLCGDREKCEEQKVLQMQTSPHTTRRLELVTGIRELKLSTMKTHNVTPPLGSGS